MRNEADSLMYTTEKSLKEFGDKVSASDKASIESAMADLKKTMEGQDLEAIKAKTEALKQASYKLAEEIYKTAGAQQGQAGGTGGAGGADGQGGPGFAGGPDFGDAGNASGGAGPQGGASGKADDVDYRVVDEEEKK